MTIKQLFKKLDIARKKYIEAESKASDVFIELVPYINDYSEESYKDWSIVFTTDGICLTDNNSLNAYIEGIISLIEKNGSVNKEDIYSCSI